MLSKNISNYKINIDINSNQIKNQVIEIELSLNLIPTKNELDKIETKIVYSTIIELTEEIKDKKEVEKIILIDDAHLMNEAASNCLLKTLEEPSNGIFILLTSRLNLLLDTIISRCQLIRFKSFSYKQLEIFIRNNLDSTVFDIYKEIDLEYFINSANGSPGKILKDIKIWNQLPNALKENLNFPLSDNLEILKITKLISEELDIDQQMFLINFVQQKCWAKTRNKNILKKLEDLKVHLKGFIQPRLAWEVTLLKIAIEDL